MSVGKYSPTVSAAYGKDQDWWRKNGGGTVDVNYDIDGYDSYGYGRDDKDRAGHAEEEYMFGEWIEHEDGETYVYELYDAVSMRWTFKDGKPVRY